MKLTQSGLFSIFHFKSVKISKETLDLVKNGIRYLVSKTVNGAEKYIPFFEVTTRQESKVSFFEYEPKRKGFYCIWREFLYIKNIYINKYALHFYS